MSLYIKGKGYFEESGRPIGSKRKVDLMRANVYGKENNTEAFTSLMVESRVSQQLLKEEFSRGRRAMTGAVQAPRNQTPIDAIMSGKRISIFDL